MAAIAGISCCQLEEGILSVGVLIFFSGNWNFTFPLANEWHFINKVAPSWNWQPRTCFFHLVALFQGGLLLVSTAQLRSSAQGPILLLPARCHAIPSRAGGWSCPGKSNGWLMGCIICKWLSKRGAGNGRGWMGADSFLGTRNRNKSFPLSLA